MQKRPRLHVYYNWQIYPDKHVHLVRCGPILCHWCLLVVCYRPNVGPTEVTTRVDLVSFSKIPYLDRSLQKTETETGTYRSCYK